MSKDNDSPVRSMPRFRVGFLSVTQSLFVVVIFFAANFLSSQHHRPFDISDDLGFTLAPSTQRYLRSEAITEREDPIRMIVAFRADSPFYERIRPVAEEYVRLSGGKIKLLLLDPIRANDQAESIAAEYNILFNQDLVIIDARSSEERKSSQGKQASPHVHISRLEDMVAYETDANNQRRVRAFLGEDALRAGLVNAIEGSPKRMWVLTDKSQLGSESGQDVWPVLSANLASQNILPERVQLAGKEAIPPEVDAIAIIGARYDLSAEELKLIEAYWNRPRASILVTTGGTEVPPRLRSFLRSQGVTPRSDRVIAEKNDGLTTRVVAHFTAGMDLTKDLWEKSTMFEGSTCSLEVREGAEDLLNRRIAPFSLLEADPRYWGDTEFLEEPVTFDPDKDHPSPLSLAAAVLKGTATDERFANDTGRMIVISNSDFLQAERARQTNLDFLASATNWLVGRDSLTGEAPRNLRLYRLPLLPAQVTFINRINLLVIPAALLLIGLMTWAGRRA